MTEKTEKFTRKDSSGRVTTTEITTTESMEGLSPKMKELLAKATTSEKPTRGGSWSKVVKSEVITTSRTSSLASDQPMSTITSTEVITRKDSLGDIERKGSAKKPAPLDLNKKGIRQITSSEIATFEAHDKKAVNFQASEQYKMALEQPSYISASEFQPPPDSDEEEYDEERLLLAERDLAENAPWKMIQQNTFTRWCNEHLKVYNDQNLLIKNLATDLKDGIRLARLVESLSQKRIKGITTRAKIHIQHMGNITSVLEFLKKEQIDLVNIDSQHINEGHMKLILGLIWKLILHYSISLARWDDEDELSPRKTGGRARLLDWMQANVTDHYGGPPIRNFTKDWNDGIRLGALVDSKAPGLCPNWDEWQPTNAFNNANTAIDLAADWLDVAKIIEPDEIINPNVDEKSLMTYLSQFPLARPKDGAPLQPFCKPHRARAFGLGIEYKGCVVGQPAQFRVETYGAGQGELQIRVLDPSNQQVEVEITWARQLIKDAPFKVNVGSVAGDSRKCRAEGPGLQLNGLVAGIPTEFNVYTEGAGGSGLVDSSITDPNGRKDTVQMRIERNPNNVNQYNVKYLPTVPGPHNIKVTFGGTHVPGSPFTVNISPNEQMMKPAVDPRKVRVTGRGVRPKGLRVNEPAVFTIYPSDAGEATVSVQILGPGGVQVSCQKQQLPGTNDWECVYYPQVPGPYKVLVQYGGQEVPGSPFNVMVDRTSQSRVIAYGPGLHGGRSGLPATFTVDTRGEPDANLGFSIEGPSEAQINAVDNGDGSCKASYLPVAPGDYIIHISCNNEDINGSPYCAKIQPSGPDTTKVKVTGPGIQPTGVSMNKPTEFDIDITASQPGEPVEVLIVDKDGDVVEPIITESGPGHYKVQYTPTKPQKHTVYVIYSGVSVDQSPYQVNVDMGLDLSSVYIENLEPVVKVNIEEDFHIMISTETINKLPSPTVIMTSPSRRITHCEVRRHDNGYVVLFTAEEEGTHEITIYFGQTLYTANAYTIEAKLGAESSRVRTYGNGLISGDVNVPAEFYVDTKGAGSGALGLEIEGPSEAHIDCKDDSKGLCHIQYFPTVPGEYLISVKYADEHIPGSPFKAVITANYDALRTVLSGNGLHSARVDEWAEIRLGTSQAGSAQATCEVVGPRAAFGLVIPVDAQQIDNENWILRYLPREEGPHTVSVRYGGQHVPKSPLRVHVKPYVDVRDIKVFRLINEAFIDGVHDFIVNARNKPKRTGNEEVRVIISAPSGRRTAAKVRPQGDGTYDIQYVLKELGPHTFEVTFQGAPVPNSPFTVNAKRGRNVHRIEAVGEGLRQGVVGKPAGFMVITKNAGPGSLGVFIEGPSEAKTTFKDNKDGTCNLDYLPTKPGDYNITIKYEDEEIPGSPFVAHISDGSGPLSARADPGAVRVLGPSLRPGGEPVFASEPQHFSVDARQAGRAPVQCRVVDPTQQEVPGTRVTDNYDGTYGVQWTPEDAGPHSVNVLFDGQPVPESPFNVNAQPTGNAGACVFSGLKPTVPVHQDTPFTVDARNAGRGNITCSADGPDGRKYPVVVNNNGNGTFTGHFTPNLPGNYKLNIKFGGRPISNSPFTTQATPGGSDSIDSSMISPSFYQPQQSYPGDAPYSPISPSQVAPNQAGKGYPGPGGYPQQGGKAPQTAPGSQPGPGIYPSQGGAPSKTAPGAYPGSGPQTTPGSQPGYGYPNQGGAPPKTAPGTYPSQTGPVPQTPTGAQPGYSYPQSAGTQPGQGYPSQGSPLSPGKAAPMSPGYPNQVGPAAQGGYPSQAAPGGYPSQSVPYNQGARPVNEPLMTQSQPPSNLQSPRGAYPPGRMEEPISAAKSPGNVNSPYFPRDNVPYDENISPISQKPQHTPFSPRSGIPVKPLGKDTPIGAMTPFDVCIQVDTSTPSGKITAEVVNPSGKRSSPEVVINPDGTISVKHTPTEVGKHDLYVSYNGANIQGSPFQFFVDALSPGRATAYGPGLTSGIVNRPCFFNVCSKSPRGPDGLRVSVQGPSRAEVQCTDNGDGSVTCQYLPTVAGDYTIEVSCNNQTVSGSPFLAKIQDPYADVRTKRIPMGTPSQVMLTISEPNLELLNATIRRPTGIEEKVTLTKMPTGSIGITFTPKEAGEHLVNVFKNGHHIPNSPFTISVSPAELGDANKVRVWGPGVEKGRVNQTERFFVDMKEAGYSNLSLSIEGPSQASLDCADKEPGVCEVTYMPTEAGEYRITVKYGDRPVPNSPFVVNVEPSGEVFSSEKMRPMQYNPAATSIGSECELTLRVPDASPNEMQAQVLNPHGQPENARIGIDKDGKFTVSFIPQMQGVHLVHVYHRGREIYGSPFPFTVGPTPEEELGAPLVKAYGPGLQFAEAGKPAEFVVMTREAGGGSLSVAVEGPAKTDIDLQDNKDGSSNIIYYPTLPGEYKVNIKFNEQHIPNSPFTVTCHPNLFPPFSRPSAGLLPNQPSSFVVSLPNVYSVNEIDARLYTPLNTEIPCQLQKLDNQGNYSIKFTPTVTGEHRVDAKVWGAHIPGSPFYFKVGDIRGDPTRVFADGEGLYRGTTGRSCEFIVNTCNAGKGTLQVTIDGPSRVTMDCVEVEEGYKVSYTPLVAGQYDITVKYAGPYHINGSPFRAIITGSNIMGHAPQRDHADLIVETVSKTTRSGVPLPTKDQPPRAQQVQCRGPGLKRADLGRPTNFIVDSSKAGNSMLLVGVKGPYHPVEEIVVKHLGNNEFDIKYRPVETGSHSVIVKWNDEHVPGSPFNVLVV